SSEHDSADEWQQRRNRGIDKKLSLLSSSTQRSEGSQRPSELMIIGKEDTTGVDMTVDAPPAEAEGNPDPKLDRSVEPLLLVNGDGSVVPQELGDELG
ncbi:unnamed protein product, partial [Amoebophrya sp. A25]